MNFTWTPCQAKPMLHKLTLHSPCPTLWHQYWCHKFQTSLFVYCLTQPPTLISAFLFPFGKVSLWGWFTAQNVSNYQCLQTQFVIISFNIAMPRCHTHRCSTPGSLAQLIYCYLFMCLSSNKPCSVQSNLSLVSLSETFISKEKNH